MNDLPIHVPIHMLEASPFGSAHLYRIRETGFTGNIRLPIKRMVILHESSAHTSFFE
jgi:hypothetical protein